MGFWALTNRVYVERFYDPFLAVSYQNNILRGIIIYHNCWQDLLKSYFYNQISDRFWTNELLCLFDNFTEVVKNQVKCLTGSIAWLGKYCK